jgi:hypothetical protein
MNETFSNLSLKAHMDRNQFDFIPVGLFPLSQRVGVFLFAKNGQSKSSLSIGMV